MKKNAAFTLIELLIVVAIIAILAAIAVPNFLEAQVRSKVSRVKNDMRSMATGLESYRVDNSRYPPDRYFYQTKTSINPDLVLFLQVLTTPVAYMTKIPDEVFQNKTYGSAYIGKGILNWYVYYGQEWKEEMFKYFGGIGTKFRDTSAIWSISSLGPDMRQNQGPYFVFGTEGILDNPTLDFLGQRCTLYDSTNGTVSMGDIVRVGP